MKYLITGGSGFLGKHLVNYMTAKGLNFVATTRSGAAPLFTTGDLTTFSRWSELFQGVDVVIHSAAKAHDMSGDPDLKRQYTETNLTLTNTLASEAKANGVKRFIFISTIKVNGESTKAGEPFTADDVPAPNDDYGISKHRAEQQLMNMHQPGVFEVVIIRPCLVYGEGVKANFKNLMELVRKGFPLPFGAIHNKRSLVSVDNLIDLIMVCTTHPNAGGKIFLVSDDHDLSLTELIRQIASTQNKKLILIPIPQSLFSFGLKLLGKKDLAQRLLSNLQVDISQTKKLLQWKPPYTMEQTLSKIQ